MKIQHNYKMTMPLCPVNKTVMAHFMKENDKPILTDTLIWRPYFENRKSWFGSFPGDLLRF